VSPSGWKWEISNRSEVNWTGSVAQMNFIQSFVMAINVYVKVSRFLKFRSISGKTQLSKYSFPNEAKTIIFSKLGQRDNDNFDKLLGLTFLCVKDDIFQKFHRLDFWNAVGTKMREREREINDESLDC
jgi:hypothetical protein